MHRNTEIGAMSDLELHVCEWSCKSCTFEWAVMLDTMSFVRLARSVKTYSERERERGFSSRPACILKD
jgi:hypothetical protein